MTSTGHAPSGAAHRIDGDPVLAHVVAKAEATAAYVLGAELTALCGFTWVPSRDPDRYPLCRECVRAARRIGRRTIN